MSPVIARIEQAAYDVLWNKKTWKSSSKERRQVWRPRVATLSATNALRITKGDDATFSLHMLDPFQAFSYDASFNLPELPPHLWASWPVSRSAFSGTVHLEE